MSALTVKTPLGSIVLQLRKDAAPTTAEYISKLAAAGLYNGASFYRSDFVIQVRACACCCWAWHAMMVCVR